MTPINNAHKPILLITFLMGIILSSVHLILIRQLYPFVGNGISNMVMVLISLFLFGGIGVTKGVELPKEIKYELRKNIIVTGFLTAVGCSYFFAQYLFSSFISILPSKIILVIFLLIASAPISFLLCQAIVFTSKLPDNKLPKNELYYISIVSSCFFGFLTGLLITLLSMKYLGVAYAVTILVIIIGVLISKISSFSKQEQPLWRLSFLLIMVVLMNPMLEVKLFVHTNDHFNHQVFQESQLVSKPESTKGNIVIDNQE